MFLCYSLILFVVCVLVMLYLVPEIISVVQSKRLMDKPNQRSSHRVETPSLGGIAFFLVFVVSLSVNNDYDYFSISMSVLPGLTVLFFIGLKDDLIALSPKRKLFGQAIACMFILMNPQFSLENLHGLFGIYEIPFWLGLLIGLVLMVGIINSFNLIDGIDGLASFIAIIIFAFFAVIFEMLNFKLTFLLAVSMTGILVGFLFFNLSKSKKIFMGDTGSMQVGFVIALMSMRLLAVDDAFIDRLPFNAAYTPFILVGLLIVPLYDAGRVSIMRVLKGKSPFSASRDHFHHLLIDAFQWSHWKASFFIALFNIVFLAVIFVTLEVFSLSGFIFVILSSLILMTFYSVKLEKRIIRSKLEKESDKKVVETGSLKPPIFQLHETEQHMIK